ncbi:MAG: hypothetical protein JKP96_12480 [Oceanicaulis sp.]|jgi:hypothetical protein|nr:hypothetical protein [Oceanicaulis sp.]
MTEDDDTKSGAWLGLSPKLWLALLFGVFVMGPLVMDPFLDGLSDAIAGRPNAVQERGIAE